MLDPNLSNSLTSSASSTASMTSPSYQDRFQRTQLILGEEAQRHLQQSRVAVVGLGAVGGYALEALARLGIGEFLLIDFDVVQASNFNRQLLAIEPNLGRLKAECARERVLAINPEAKVTIRSEFFHAEAFEQLLGDFAGVEAHRKHLVVDCIDSLNPKVTLLELLFRNKIPVLSSMGAACRSDPQAVRIGDISEVSLCPLGSRVRARLRRRQIPQGIRCVYSVEPPLPPLKSEAPLSLSPVSRGRPRQAIGSLSFMTGIFGLTLASEAWRYLLSR